MTIFSLFIFLIMLIVGGMAVDLMRFEATRVRLQEACDRAVLAAADLEQARDAREVVREYFESAGFDDGELGEVSVEQDLGHRIVTATATASMDTYLMDLVGVESLDAPASCRAQEGADQIEIVLVLDVSGSMVQNGSTRLANLQAAAREFVRSILANDTERRVSIAIVPFNGQVMVGSPPGTDLPGNVLRDRYTVAYTEGNAWPYCIDLDPTVYGAQTLSRALEMPATAYANTWDFGVNITDSNGDQVPNTVPNAYTDPTLRGNTNVDVRHDMWCPSVTQGGASTAGNVVRLPSRNVADLQRHISGLRGVGATSINAGMRWGTALLDPASQPMFDTLIGAGAIPAEFRERPFAYDRDNTFKIIVLMTDGENFPEERVRTGFHAGTSDIHRADLPDGRYSIFHRGRVNSNWPTAAARAISVADSRPFYVPHRNEWHARPWNGTTPNPVMPYAEAVLPADHPRRFGANPVDSLRRFDVDGDNDCDNNDQPGRGALRSDEACWFDAGAQDWRTVWATQRMSWVAQQLYARAGILSDGRTGGTVLSLYNRQMDLFRERTGDILPGRDLTTGMDDQLAQVCQRAKASGILVFGIAFEAPPGGQDVVRRCASVGRYYEADNDANDGDQVLDIGAVFEQIAGNIVRLRLSQ